MSKFIEVTDSRYGEKLLLNLDSIVVIHLDQNRVLVSGVHGERTGFYSFDSKTMDTILRFVKGLQS